MLAKLARPYDPSAMHQLPLLDWMAIYLQGDARPRVKRPVGIFKGV